MQGIQNTTPEKGTFDTHPKEVTTHKLRTTGIKECEHLLQGQEGTKVNLIFILHIYVMFHITYIYVHLIQKKNQRRQIYTVLCYLQETFLSIQLRPILFMNKPKSVKKKQRKIKMLRRPSKNKERLVAEQKRVCGSNSVVLASPSFW